MMIPREISLEKWAQSLIIDFPQDNIPILPDAKYWRDWGDVLVQENSFSLNAAPATAQYPDWQAWAKDVFYTMANF